MARSLLRLSGISKSFSGVKVLDEVSLALASGEVVGLVGENGSGKSTTMNIVAGVLAPDSGDMTIANAIYAPENRRVSEHAGVAFVQQELNIFSNLTVGQNLFLGRTPRLWGGLPLLSHRRLASDAKPWLDAVGLRVDPATPAASLSAGERQLLEIARALTSNPSILIFDEPTTSLTEKEVTVLFELISQLKQRGTGILYVSHALEDVLRLSDRILVLRDGRLTLDAPRSMLTSSDLIVAMVGRTVDGFLPDRSARKTDVQVLLDAKGIGAHGIVDDISLTVSPGEIVGITGLMGAGRTELARILFGLDPHDSGGISIGGIPVASGDIRARLDGGMAFLTEDRRHEGLMMDATVAENFSLAALPLFVDGAAGKFDRTRLGQAVADMAQKLRLKSGAVEKTAIRSLSGGNQQKVLIGRWMLRQPRLFVLDEPTRGVDVGSKEEIYRLLAGMADAGAGLIVISSEIEEVMELADRIMVLHRGRIAGWFDRGRFDRHAILNAAFGQECAA
jgi:ABC-type sugar transport system ATPase subunit